MRTWSRTHAPAGEANILVLTNFSGTEQKASLGAYAGKNTRLLKANFATNFPDNRLNTSLTLPAYGSFVAEIK